MDNIEPIHIAKMPYSIEPKAKTELKKYLSDVKSRLDVDTADEVLHDIESRIPELLAQHHTKQGDVVTHADILFVKKQLGEPEQFAIGSDESSERSDANSKKLFRDSDNAMLGGVASGIGKYFSIDANIIRVAFFALLFFYGFGIVLYLFLWLLLPEAKTSADKLLMSGEPVTVSTLQRYQTTVNKSLSSSPRIIQRVLRKFFRFISVLFTCLVSLYLLCIFGILSALFYVYPFRSIVSGYNLDYIFLGLVWLGCLSFISLLVLITAKIWGHTSSRINITAAGLIVLLIVTIAGESTSGLLIYNHFANKYGGDKSVRALSLSGTANTTPTSLVVYANNNLDLTYDVTSQPLHATYTYYPGMTRPNITITNTKGAVTVDANQLVQAVPDCLGDICKHIYLPVHVYLYGPSLKEYDNTAGASLMVNASDLGKAATFVARDQSITTINNGNVGTMTISSASGSNVNVNNTTAQTANITVDATSSVTGPVTNTVDATLPDDCANPTPGAGTLLFLANYPNEITINGEPQVVSDVQQNSCIESNL
jgi:phage shock protein PspC (stress-responsive transcriptional regulator)